MVHYHVIYHCNSVMQLALVQIIWHHPDLKEVHYLPQGQAYSLHFHEGWGFVRSTGSGEVAWVAQLGLQWKAVRCQDREDYDGYNHHNSVM